MKARTIEEILKQDFMPFANPEDKLEYTLEDIKLASDTLAREKGVEAWLKLYRNDKIMKALTVPELKELKLTLIGKE